MEFTPEYLAQLASQYGLKTLSLGSIHIELSEQALNIWATKQIPQEVTQEPLTDEQIHAELEKTLFHSVL